ncbi:HAMP domain-containing sensor histidine kinase [Paenibacillus sp. ISL-20]|uniref:sensor histidine kinase n=1 Tax=Paenibacillus sp. ISL-20 TaxID=2819163 RepID=UPI001BE4E2F3|nr:HAMP domain-containing sensor histidine kinase [Paenibacillus sp. ISL-20]MBT2765209.1 HAMP domain-containing histidine kinase [Paenibacillus sp. ISL-20]
MRWRRKQGRFRNSLTNRYLLLISMAMIFMPIMFPLASIFYWFVNDTFSDRPPAPVGKYTSGAVLEKMWHAEAAGLSGASPKIIEQKLNSIRQEYPEISMFWVDGSNETRLQLPAQSNIPEVWSALYTVQFMKNSLDGDPFTSVAFIGGEGSGEGFMVMQLPRKYISVQQPIASETALYGLFMALMSGLFILVSWLFFVRIRKRLLRLRFAMTSPHMVTGIPQPVTLTKHDEIGQLEAGYNDMVIQLEEGQRRQREEEELRKSLIANLSHDLRTPLTVIRSHIFSMEREPLSEKGKASLSLIESKIADLGGLIDNLLSYNLLTSGRVQLNMEPTDVLRIVKESAAAWYPVWEKAGIEPDIQVRDEPLSWNVDVLWFRRLLDNLFQNVVRHAKSGKYIGIHTEEREGLEGVLVISDHGPGIESDSGNKGTGIGLAIVDHLTREMGLGCHVESSDEGTRIRIWKR